MKINTAKKLSFLLERCAKRIHIYKYVKISIIKNWKFNWLWLSNTHKLSAWV